MIPSFISRFVLVFSIICHSVTVSPAQNVTADYQAITTTLMNYIDGTAKGEPEKVRSAFHPDFQLYSVNEYDSLKIRSGNAYINNIKPGERTERQGRIIAIDIENNAAMAKAEIAVPGWRIFTDYFLLLRYEGAWKIVQKSYTWRPWPVDPKK